MAGDGIETTGPGTEALFDVNADGTADRTSMVTGGDALLALDRNGNGIIDNGSELFGDQNGPPDGFAELARYDTHEDGVIDSRDSIFNLLKLWRDDGDGQTGAGEPVTLLQAGIRSIHLRQVRSLLESSTGADRISASSVHGSGTGTSGRIGDVWLKYRPAEGAGLIA